MQGQRRGKSTSSGSLILPGHPSGSAFTHFSQQSWGFWYVVNRESNVFSKRLGGGWGGGAIFQKFTFDNEISLLFLRFPAHTGWAVISVARAANLILLTQPVYGFSRSAPSPLPAPWCMSVWYYGLSGLPPFTLFMGASTAPFFFYWKLLELLTVVPCQRIYNITDNMFKKI